MKKCYTYHTIQTNSWSPQAQAFGLLGILALLTPIVLCASLCIFASYYVQYIQVQLLGQLCLFSFKLWNN